LPGLFYFKIFGVDMTMPLRRANLYLWYGWLATKCQWVCTFVFEWG